MTKLTFAPVLAAAAVDYDSTVVVVVEHRARGVRVVGGADAAGVEVGRGSSKSVTIAPSAAATVRGAEISTGGGRRKPVYQVTREIVAYDSGLLRVLAAASL